MLGHATVNWIMTAEAVGLILLIIVRLNCQDPLLSYLEDANLLVVMNTDNLGGQETRRKRPKTSAFIIQFTMA